MTVQTLVLQGFPRPETARSLSPNGRAHWRQKNAASALVHRYVAVAAVQQGLQPMQGFVVLRPTFTFPDHRRRDGDNLATGVIKATIDGLVKRGYLVDDDVEHVRLEPVQVAVEKGVRRLVLELEENGPAWESGADGHNTLERTEVLNK